MRTLIVEDNATSRELLAKLLAPFGVCQAVPDGPAALEAFEDALNNNGGFDLVCLDVMMPHMDGHEVLAAIRDLEETHRCRDHERCTVIMTTAVDSHSCIEKARQGGGGAYMVKPIRRVPLYQQLQRLGLVDNFHVM